jgi:hypothetical protein
MYSVCSQLCTVYICYLIIRILNFHWFLYYLDSSPGYCINLEFQKLALIGKHTSEVWIDKHNILHTGQQ